jgi:hypothetical protein
MNESPPRILFYAFSALIWIVFLIYFIPHHYIAS